jgi:hypothetical protein
MLPPYLGNCLCGQVTFQLTAEPLTYYACHCTDCQRRTGGAMRLAMWVSRSSLQVLSGEPALLEFEIRPGRQRRAKACAKCDTRLWAEPADRPSLAVLLPGVLQNVSHFEPVAHLWVKSALPWVGIPSGVAKFDTQPNDPKELIRLWRAATSSRGAATAS